MSRTAAEIALKLRAAEPRLHAMRGRISTAIGNYVRGWLHQRIFEEAIELTAAAHMEEIRRLTQRATDSINIRLDEFVVSHFGHCPRCRGEIFTSFHSAAECAFGDTYVTSCLECEWVGEPH